MNHKFFKEETIHYESLGASSYIDRLRQNPDGTYAGINQLNIDNALYLLALEKPRTIDEKLKERLINLGVKKRLKGKIRGGK